MLHFCKKKRLTNYTLYTLELEQSMSCDTSTIIIYIYITYTQILDVGCDSGIKNIIEIAYNCPQAQKGT